MFSSHNTLIFVFFGGTFQSYIFFCGYIILNIIQHIVFISSSYKTIDFNYKSRQTKRYTAVLVTVKKTKTEKNLRGMLDAINAFGISVFSDASNTLSI